jgi:hypothetical protein
MTIIDPESVGELKPVRALEVEVPDGVETGRECARACHRSTPGRTIQRHDGTGVDLPVRHVDENALWAIAETTSSR